MQKKIQLSFLIMALAGTLVLSGCGFRETNQAYRVDLEVWGVFDDSDAYAEVINQYKRLNPHVGEITYRKFLVDTYRQDLLDALAAGNGPDIFLIQNTWTPQFRDKVLPAPDALMDEKAFRETFADVVAKDFLSPDRKILGAPLSADALALYYNKDLFNAAGITVPPATWEALIADVGKLTRIDAFGTINQSAIALGTAADPLGNINRATDILTALFFQSGVPILDETESESTPNLRGGENALRFYTQFATPTDALYTWNPRLHYSLDSFYEGRLAMMINYSWHGATIKRKNAKINFGVAPLPQFGQGGMPANVANYWGFVVAKNKTASPKNLEQQPILADPSVYNKVRAHEAWQMLKFMTFPNGGKVTLSNGLTGNTQEFPVQFDPAGDYLTRTQKPAARRDLIEIQKRDVFLGPFVSGNLLAKNWTQADPSAVEGIFSEMIASVNRGEATLSDALKVGENRLQRFGR